MADNEQTRTFYLYEQIDQSAILELTKAIMAVIEVDNKDREKIKDYKEQPIRLYINSYGGQVDSMFALINVILSSKTPIYTYCTGIAGSAAFQIFLAGHKRFAYKNTRMLYHQIQTYHDGYYPLASREDDVEEEKRLQESIEQFVISRTKCTQEYLKEVYEHKKDWWIHSDDYIKYGIVDEVLDV